MKRPYREEEQLELGRGNKEKKLSIRLSGVRRKGWHILWSVVKKKKIKGDKSCEKKTSEESL